MFNAMHSSKLDTRDSARCLGIAIMHDALALPRAAVSAVWAKANGDPLP